MSQTKILGASRVPTSKRRSSDCRRHSEAHSTGRGQLGSAGQAACKVCLGSASIRAPRGTHRSFAKNFCGRGKQRATTPTRWQGTTSSGWNSK
eukprot:4248263-Pyramimonas_sp.AAC.1